MSNVTPINRAAKGPAETQLDAALKGCLFDVESGTIAAAVATDALEKLEDELAQEINDDNRGLYATLVLIRGKLRDVIEEIDRACDRARAVVYPDKAAEARAGD